MAGQNVCNWNKYGYCRHQELCRSLHVKEVCVSASCDSLNCMLRQPITCKYYTNYNRCKFNPCAFKHIENAGETDIENLRKENKELLEKVDKIDKELKALNERESESEMIIDRLNQIEKKFELLVKEKDDKIESLEMVIKDTNLNVFEQEKKISLLNKKFGVLRDKLCDKEKEDVNDKIEPLKHSDHEIQTLDIKCEKCEFTSKNDAAMKTHIRSKHLTCWTCNFICDTKQERTIHNDKYYYSHRMALNRNHRKYILEEFEQLKQDGFIVNESSISEVSNWPAD